MSSQPIHRVNIVPPGSEGTARSLSKAMTRFMAGPFPAHSTRYPDPDQQTLERSSQQSKPSCNTTSRSKQTHFESAWYRDRAVRVTTKEGVVMTPSNDA